MSMLFPFNSTSGSQRLMPTGIIIALVGKFGNKIKSTEVLVRGNIFQDFNAFGVILL